MHLLSLLDAHLQPGPPSTLTSDLVLLPTSLAICLVYKVNLLYQLCWFRRVLLELHFGQFVWERVLGLPENIYQSTLIFEGCRVQFNNIERVHFFHHRILLLQNLGVQLKGFSRARCLPCHEIMSFLVLFTLQHLCVISIWRLKNSAYDEKLFDCLWIDPLFTTKCVKEVENLSNDLFGLSTVYAYDWIEMSLC